MDSRSSSFGAAAGTPGDGGYVLRTELKLDGTHVHPRYVSLLEEALRQSEAAQAK